MADPVPPGPDPAAPTRRSLLRAAPLGLAAVAGAGGMVLLNRMRRGTYDPHAVNDPLVGHPIPDFTLAAQPPSPAGFSAADVRAAGRPVLLNFFASWCIPCLQEAPALMALHDSGLIPVWGVAYQDAVAAADAFLQRNGNPYQRLARDVSGTVAIDFGLYGVPESYLIDRAGILRWRFAGPLTESSGLPRLRSLLVQLA